MDSFFGTAPTTPANGHDCYFVQAASCLDSPVLHPSADPTRCPGSTRYLRQVWHWNFEQELDALAAVASSNCGGAVVALDTEFPGFVIDGPRSISHAAQYQAVRENVNLLSPIQIGLAVASPDGTLLGVWNFNLRFDLALDLHTSASIAFLQASGIDFQKHAKYGITAKRFGKKLAQLPFFGCYKNDILWVTFGGAYDFGYFLKTLTNQALPSKYQTFETALAGFCPWRVELQNKLRTGSLDDHARMRDVRRCGLAHTAGCDSLTTLDLYFLSEPAFECSKNLMIDGAVSRATGSNEETHSLWIAAARGAAVEAKSISGASTSLLRKHCQVSSEGTVERAEGTQFLLAAVAAKSVSDPHSDDGAMVPRELTQCVKASPPSNLWAMAAKQAAKAVLLCEAVGLRTWVQSQRQRKEKLLQKTLASMDGRWSQRLLELTPSGCRSVGHPLKRWTD